jgi:hypothetical protein
VLPLKRNVSAERLGKVGGIAPLRSQGARFQNLGRMGQYPIVGDGCYQNPRLWQVARSCHTRPSKVAFPSCPGLRILVIEQFWGRAVRASCDSHESGALLILGAVLGARPFLQERDILRSSGSQASVRGVQDDLILPAFFSWDREWS